MKDSTGGLIAVYMSTALLALNGLFAKLIPLDVASMTQLRSVVAFVALGLFIYFQKASLRVAGRKQLFQIYGLGVLLGLHWLTYFYAMQTATVAIGMLSLFTYPVITVILEPLFKGERPHLVDLLAALLVFVDIIVMVAGDLKELFSSESELTGDGLPLLVGAGWGVVSAFLFAFRNVFQKHSFQNVSSSTLMAHQVFIVALLLVPFLQTDQILDLDFLGVVSVVLLGVFSTAAAHTLLSIGLKKLPVKSVAMISCALPVMGAFLAWLVLGEIPTLPVLTGGAIIIAVAAYESIKQNAK